MKKLIICIAFVLSVCMAFANETIKEDFNTLKNGTAYNGNVSLPTGIWEMSKVLGNASNGTTSVKFNTNDGFIVSPAFDKPAKVGFYYRSGGSNKPVTVSYSTDNGNTWTELETFTIKSSSSAFSAYSKKTGLENVGNVRIRIACSSSNVFIDDFSVTLSTGEEPGGPVVDPDDPTYITTGVPIPTKPFPEAIHTYFISPNGNDVTGDGSFETPWYNIAVAYAKAEAGDHIVCRGGTYKINHYGTDGKLTVRMTKNGTAEHPIVIRPYEDEKPVFDFEQQLLDCHRDKSKVGDRGILLTGNYHYIFGLHITHAADNGIKLEGSHNRIERCEFSYNLDTGLQLGFGHDFSASGHGSSNNGEFCAYNDIVDCDSHHNCDFDMNYGSDADGFACKMHNGKGNRFIRCRAWRNSDDAWDLYETDYSVVLAECWAWESGKAEDHTWVKEYLDGSASFSGNGNGIKLGGNGSGGSSKGIHYAYNCIAFGCNKSGSVKGFDCNSHKDGHVIIGCLAFDNGYDFMFESGGSEQNTAFYNNICLGRQEICVGADDYNALNFTPSKNGWTNHLVTGATKDDFVSLDEEDALMPRSIDGSLPRRFGRLASDSKMIDAGSAEYDIPESLLIDFPFLKRTITGSSRDLGPYERKDTPTAISSPVVSKNASPCKIINSHGILIRHGNAYYNVFGMKMKNKE